GLLSVSDEHLYGWVVVTIAGSRLIVTRDAAQSLFNASARLGHPLGLVCLADKAHGPSFAVACGLVKWGAHARTDHSDTHHTVTFGITYQKTVRWLRDFF